MNRDLDALIRDAAPSVPDSGDARRLNRALLRQRMARDVVRKARRRRVIVVAAGAALLFLGAGNVRELGSDHFDLKQKKVLEDLGVTAYEMGFGGQGITRYDGQTEGEALEFAIKSMLDEGEFHKITGLFTENGYYWSIQYKAQVDDQVAITGREVRDVSSHRTKYVYEFTKAHWEDLLDRLGRIPAPNPRQIEMTIEGQSRNFDYWRLVYPDFGPIEYYVTESPR